MLPINTENFGIIYPIKLTSPLPIAECKNRLQQSLGKAMGSLFTTIEGEVDMVDETTCKFRLYQDVSKGGRRNIVGYLYAQNASSTEVDAIFGIERYPYAFLLIASMLFTILVTFLFLQEILMALVVVLLTSGFFYLEHRRRSSPPQPPRLFKKEPMSQLLWWFERTLKQ